jgi:hypothetical protein
VRLRTGLGLSVAAVVTVVVGALTALAAGTFSDDDGNTHEGNIEAIAAEGITKGCNPPANDLYCPDDPVTRGQMAAFLVRAMGYTDNGGSDLFDDDDSSTFENDIDKLATAEVTKGCNPPANTNYCPDDFVTRGQMAAFLVRAMAYTDDGGGDLFDDDDGSTFDTDIDKLGTAGVTLGCNPPDNTMYCPDDVVTRDQMASFLARALELDPIPPSTTSTTSSTTSTTTSPSCDPSYPDFCIPPPPPDLSCSDIPQKDFTVLPPDPHGFDGNENGIGCES